MSKDVKSQPILINRAHCKEYALQMIETRYVSDVMQSIKPTRVSGEFYLWLDAQVKDLIKKRVFNRCGGGKTL